MPVRGLCKARAVGRGIPGEGERIPELEMGLEGQRDPREGMEFHARDSRSKGVVAEAMATASPPSSP